MGYFSRFPFIKDYEIDDRKVTLPDLTRRTSVSEQSRSNNANFITYVLKDETPEILADRMYDDATMSWVILLFNRVFNIYEEWPLDSVSFEYFIEDKYGESKFDVRYYKSAATGAVVDSSHPEYDRIPVTNYDYELELNDIKRYIKVPTLEAAQEIKKQHNRLVQR